MALSYYSSQKCCLGGVKLEGYKTGRSQTKWIVLIKKVHCKAARLTTNLSDRERACQKFFAVKQKMRIMVMLVDEKKKKHSEVKPFVIF